MAVDDVSSLVPSLSPGTLLALLLAARAPLAESTSWPVVIRGLTLCVARESR